MTIAALRECFPCCFSDEARAPVAAPPGPFQQMRDAQLARATTPAEHQEPPQTPPNLATESTIDGNDGWVTVPLDTSHKV